MTANRGQQQVQHAPASRPQTLNQVHIPFPPLCDLTPPPKALLVLFRIPYLPLPSLYIYSCFSTRPTPAAHQPDSDLIASRIHQLCLLLAMAKAACTP